MAIPVPLPSGFSIAPSNCSL